MQLAVPPNVYRRPREGALVVAVVLAAHAWLLDGALESLGEFEPALPARDTAVLTVRRIVRDAVPQAPRAALPAAPMAVERRSVSPSAVAPAAAPAAAVPAVDSAFVQPSGTARESAPAAPVSTLPELTAAPDPTPVVEATSAQPALAPTATPEGNESTIHPTRIAPSFRLEYTLQRGSLSGSAELTWRRVADSYELELKGNLRGIDAMWFVSRGGFDSAGLAPQRFVDRRRGRDRHAANFDRAAGRITFSGPQVTHPLLPGAQDRLSWMVQLPAIIDADPVRFAAGTRVPIFVTGARGDAGTWVFVIEDVQAQGLRLTREPQKPYDTQVEVWLDPARHHLPVRARLTTLPGGETLELVLSP